MTGTPGASSTSPVLRLSDMLARNRLRDARAGAPPHLVGTPGPNDCVEIQVSVHSGGEGGQ